MYLFSQADFNPAFLVPILFPILWVAVATLISWTMGIFRLYADFPADGNDPIESRFRFINLYIGSLGGHTPASLAFGRRCLHVKELFPFQPFFWLGPASIPWTEIRLTKRASDNFWAFWSYASFELGPQRKKIRLTGRVARALQERLDTQEAGRPLALIPR